MERRRRSQNSHSPAIMESSSLSDYVNPLQGTDSHDRFSHGNTLPLMARPFGMTHWSVMTSINSPATSWFFSPRDFSLVGVRATHQPSPWMGDYAPFCLMPITSDPAEFLVPNVTYHKRVSTFPRKMTTWTPYGFSTELLRWRIGLEVAVTERCAIFRIRFPKDKKAWVLLDDPMAMATNQGERKGFVSSWQVSQATNRLTGCTTSNSGGVPEGFKGFIALECGQEFPVTEFGMFRADGWVELGKTQQTGEQLGVMLGFGASDQERVITIKISTSFISEEQALRNLHGEIGERKYPEVREESKAIWEKHLGRIQVEARCERDLRTFYTSLYRALLFPRRFHELDDKGGPIHYSPYSGTINPGVLYTDNGFWDTHRTVYPFLALVYPSQCSEIMQGWVNAAKFGRGWFPKWASPGYRSMMVGTHSDVVVADALLRGISFDSELAYQFSRKNGTEEGDPSGAYGREGISEYISLGYVPSDRHEHGVCRTNDYAYDDFCLAQVAKHLGKKEDYHLFGARALNYRRIFHQGTGFMRGRKADGSWKEPFDEFSWGGDYVEGSAWQHVFAVPHDPAGLIKLFGGNEAFCAKLDLMLSQPPYFDIGTYWTEIHEMTEMAVQEFGQYAHSNQPVHHVLYLFACGQQPWKTEYWTRRVMSELYGPEQDGLCGDEDNGEMSSWFLLSSLGLFPLCPGHPSFVFGSPFFEKVTVHLENGAKLCVEGKGNSDPKNVYVQEIHKNGEDITHKASISHAELAKGAHLVFSMGSEPKKSRVFKEEDLPFSFSNEFIG